MFNFSATPLYIRDSNGGVARNVYLGERVHVHALEGYNSTTTAPIDFKFEIIIACEYLCTCFCWCLYHLCMDIKICSAHIWHILALESLNNS